MSREPARPRTVERGSWVPILGSALLAALLIGAVLLSNTR